MRLNKALFILFLFWGEFGHLPSPGEEVELLYSTTRATSDLQSTSAAGNSIGLLILLLLTTGAKLLDRISV
jgi:hypothetical protein